MATKSVLKNIMIKDRRSAHNLVKALEHASGKQSRDVTISRTLIAEESETAVKTRIPGTWGEGARFIWIPKADIMDIYNGKTMLTFLDRTKEYQVCDKENRIADTINGEKLYSEHYDQVEAAVRERYEKELKRRASEARAHARVAKGKEVKGCR